jgi:hypothetical protein
MNNQNYEIIPGSEYFSVEIPRAIVASAIAFLVALVVILVAI